MSRPGVPSNLVRSSPLASVRREQVDVDPLENVAPPSGPTTPQQQKLSPKANPEGAPFQRLLLPNEILEIETRNFMSQCRYI